MSIDLEETKKLTWIVTQTPTVLAGANHSQALIYSPLKQDHITP